MTLGHEDGNHAACDPDICFAAKMAYMREHGVAVHYPYGGRSAFHGATISEKQTTAVAEARSNGYEPTPVGSRWV